MVLELAELAGGLPAAASFAMAGGITAFREGRRRSALNAAVHELRRPLQAIALAAPESSGRARAFESSLRMAAAAVDRLDREINGGSAPGAIDGVPFRELVESAVDRWRVAASRFDRTVILKCAVGEAEAAGDRIEVEQAVDNLISNALVHGSGEVAVEARRVGCVLRLVVRNRRRRRRGGRVRSGEGGPATRISGRNRHGHGLRIVRRAAARSGGSFRFWHEGEEVVARLDLPLGGGPR